MPKCSNNWATVPMVSCRKSIDRFSLPSPSESRIYGDAVAVFTLKEIENPFGLLPSAIEEYNCVVRLFSLIPQEASHESSLLGLVTFDNDV
ncbi:hypothetical protein Pla144_13380 [Bythopirellula polymerisocia]|uniref:Uncharacterized protein n=1 Tax=Bythopirellula polymerisocia TaxID=2528003 RepID=A0A5C6CX80_9BACT|nr:hypothetical protein Pla144_13380 [Bythopirellula polymerisocia]